VVEIKEINSHENAWSSPELDTTKANRLAIQVLEFTRGAKFLGAGGTAKDIWTVRRISYPARGSRVEDRITPSFDVDVEATYIDIGCLGI